MGAMASESPWLGTVKLKHSWGIQVALGSEPMRKPWRPTDPGDLPCSGTGGEIPLPGRTIRRSSIRKEVHACRDIVPLFAALQEELIQANALHTYIGPAHASISHPLSEHDEFTIQAICKVGEYGFPTA